jgi:hypothetical protein
MEPICDRHLPSEEVRMVDVGERKFSLKDQGDWWALENTYQCPPARVRTLFPLPNCLYFGARQRK